MLVICPASQATHITWRGHQLERGSLFTSQRAGGDLYHVFSGSFEADVFWRFFIFYGDNEVLSMTTYHKNSSFSFSLVLTWSFFFLLSSVSISFFHWQPFSPPIPS